MLFIETSIIFVTYSQTMIEYFTPIYSDEVAEFLDTLEEKARKKIIYNIDKAKLTLDPELIKNWILTFGSLA